MSAGGTIRINGTPYRWYVDSQTVEYPGFSHEPVDILRILSEDAGFDIAVRFQAFEKVGSFHAGPMVVLGDRFPMGSRAVPKGARLRLRPKISWFPDRKVDGRCVARIVSWCLSAHFRPVPANMTGVLQNLKLSPQDDYSHGAPPPKIAGVVFQGIGTSAA